jgi:hypothetical protein
MKDDDDLVDPIRTARIAVLRERIAAARYEVDPQAVAVAVIQRMLTGAWRLPSGAPGRPAGTDSADVLEAG